MKALLVGDNTSNQNWGGRAAGLALWQILAGRFQLVGSVRGSAFLLDQAGFGYVNTFLPARYNRLFLKLRARRHQRRVYDYYIRFEELFGAKDFIADDPAKTVGNVLRYKSRHREIQALYDQVKNADLVVINGEGDIVLSTPPRREALFLLGMAELGFSLGKRVVFVNSMVSDCPVTGRNSETLGYLKRTLARCQTVTLRDSESMEYITREMPGVHVRVVPDSIFAWSGLIENSRSLVPENGDFILPFPEAKENLGKLDFSRPYVCLGGSALAARDYPASVASFTRLVKRLQELGLPVYLTENCTGDSFLQAVATETGAGLIPVNTSIFMAAAILANASLFVSGRYHPAILASLGGTPCIFLESSAHKMRSLQRVLEYPMIREFGVYPTPAESDDIVALARDYVTQGEALRQSIRLVVKKRSGEALELPDLIAGPGPSDLREAVCRAREDRTLSVPQEAVLGRAR